MRGGCSHYIQYVKGVRENFFIVDRKQLWKQRPYSISFPGEGSEQTQQFPDVLSCYHTYHVCDIICDNSVADKTNQDVQLNSYHVQWSSLTTCRNKIAIALPIYIIP